MEKKRKTVFLVDDDRTNLLLGKKALSGAYTVFTINAGAVMFELLEDITPDLILLDIHMPEMDGYEVIQRLKADAAMSHIPVVFLTAISDDALEKKGMSLGAVDYITKPFSAANLLERVNTHIFTKEARDPAETE